LKTASVLQLHFKGEVILMLLMKRHAKSKPAHWESALRTLEKDGILVWTAEKPAEGRRKKVRAKNISREKMPGWYSFASLVMRQETYKLMLSSQIKTIRRLCDGISKAHADSTPDQERRKESGGLGK
jgi:hypothetical protein